MVPLSCRWVFLQKMRPIFFEQPTRWSVKVQIPYRTWHRMIAYRCPKQCRGHQWPLFWYVVYFGPNPKMPAWVFKFQVGGVLGCELWYLKMWNWIDSWNPKNGSLKACLRPSLSLAVSSWCFSSLFNDWRIQVFPPSICKSRETW